MITMFAILLLLVAVDLFTVEGRINVRLDDIDLDNESDAFDLVRS